MEKEGIHRSSHVYSTAKEELDAIRLQTRWSDQDRDTALDRLIERFPDTEIIKAVQDRLDDLSGPDFEVLLRIVEANPQSSLARDLAEAIEHQPDLPTERIWSALEVIEGAGVLDEFPELRELSNEINEGLDDDGSIEELVEQIEEEPDGIWLALQGMAAVEIDVRPQIIAGLTAGNVGSGVIEFFRLLAYSVEPLTRSAALDSLARIPVNREVSRAWADLSLRHPDPQVRKLAGDRSKVAEPVPALQKTQSRSLSLTSPKIFRSVVTAINGAGQATIAVASIRGEMTATAIFLCDVADGVVHVHGNLGSVQDDQVLSSEPFLEARTEDPVEDVHTLALALLAGCLTLSGPATPPALRYWIEATVGADFQPLPFRASFPEWDPSEVPLSEIPDRAKTVLERLPDWLDASALTAQLAEEIQLREGDAVPDPKRDAGAYRYLFEHRLADQLERYRRMLLWMAWFWKAGGNEDLARSAMALASQLSDEQHVVPGHPFTVALTTRSLVVAQETSKERTFPGAIEL